MIKYKFEPKGLDSLIKLKIGNIDIPISGIPNDKREDEINPVITKNRIRIRVKCTGSFASWKITLTYKGKEKTIERPTEKTDNATNVAQPYTLPK